MSRAVTCRTKSGCLFAQVINESNNSEILPRRSYGRQSGLARDNSRKWSFVCNQSNALGFEFYLGP